MAFVWNCPICTFQNVFNNPICAMCQQGQRPQHVYFVPNQVNQPNIAAQFGVQIPPQRREIPEHKDNYPSPPSASRRPTIRRNLSVDDLSADSPTSSSIPNGSNGSSSSSGSGSSNISDTYSRIQDIRSRIQQQSQQQHGHSQRVHGHRMNPQLTAQQLQRQRNAYSRVFDQMSLSEQQRMLQSFLQQQDPTMAIALQDYMLRNMHRGGSTVDTKDDDDEKRKVLMRSNMTKLLHGDDGDDFQLSDEERRKLSHQFVRKFKGKTLTSFCLRQLFVENTFHSMNKKTSAIARYLTHFNNTKIYYSAIEIVLRNKDNVEETYLIYPDFVQFVNKHFLNTGGFAAFSEEIATEIGCCDMDWSDTMYRKNYGVIQSVDISNTDDIELVMTNQGFWKRHFFSDESFLKKSILPMEILEIVCYEYSGIEQDYVSLSINHPCKRTGESFDYNWICHKVKDARKNRKNRVMDCMQYRFAGKILGKYVNVTTAVKAGQRYPRRKALESDTIATRIEIFPPKWKK